MTPAARLRAAAQLARETAERVLAPATEHAALAVADALLASTGGKVET